MVKNPLANAEDIRDTGFDPSVEKIRWRRKWQPVFSSILDWRIPWTEEPGRLQFIESKRSNLACTQACVTVGCLCLIYTSAKRSTWMNTHDIEFIIMSRS